MTALSKSLTLTTGPEQAPTPIDPKLWISLEEAAARLDRNRDSLGRLCRDQLVELQLAIFGAPLDGGNRRWWIARRYDLKLAPGTVGELYKVPDLSNYSERQVSDANRRRACVLRLRQVRSKWPGRECDWLPGLITDLRGDFPQIKISRTTLLRWYQLFRTESDIVRLIDTRGGNTRGKADPAAWTIFRDLFLGDPPPSIRRCWELTDDICQQQKLTWCGYKSCCTELDERISPELQAFHRDKKRYRQMKPYSQQDPESWAANECWIGDHKQLDLVCQYRGVQLRPWLTAWMDWRTRRIMGWTLSPTPDSNSILIAFKRGVLTPEGFGLPWAVWIDNGKDYDCYTFHGRTKAEKFEPRKIDHDDNTFDGIFGMVDVEAHFSLPFNPNGKGRLERWFRTLDEFSRTFATYTGRNPEEKPEGLNSILSDHPHQVPEFRDLFERLKDHIAGYNLNDEHVREDMKGLSPDDAMAKWIPARRVCQDPAALELIFRQWHPPVSVGRNGVRILIKGVPLTFGKHAPELRRLIGTDVKVHVSYDPHQVNYVTVWDEQRRLICARAPMNKLGGHHGDDPIGVEAVREHARLTSENEKALKISRVHRQTQYRTREESIAEANQKQRRADSPVADTPMKVVRTPLDGQSEVAAGQLRRAAGAESMTPRERTLPRLDQLSVTFDSEGSDFSSAPSVFMQRELDDLGTPETSIDGGSVFDRIKIGEEL